MKGQNQNQLFYEEPRIPPGDMQFSLWELVLRKKSDRLLIPVFQRDFVWSKGKVRDWGLSVAENTPIGVVVTYQLHGTGPVYLCDGRQRLQATQHLLESPAEYGLPYDRTQMEMYCQNYMIPVQHRHFRSVSSALTAFQNLNKGTAASAADYYKGVLVLDDIGKVVYDKIPGIFDPFEVSIMSKSSLTDVQRKKHHRQAYAMLYLYLSGGARKNFGNVAAATPNTRSDGTQVESLLVQYFQDNQFTTADIDKRLTDFAGVVQNFYSLIRSCAPDEFRTKTISPTLARFLLHLYLFARNSGMKTSWFVDFSTSLLGYLDRYDSYVSKFDLPKSDPIEQVSLKLGAISHLDKLCGAFGLSPEAPSRKRRAPAPPGMHHSHVLPFSHFGEGSTFVEPALLNMSRGANPIEK